MGILLTVILLLVLSFAAVYIAGFFIPDHVRMQRAIMIEAPRGTVFRLVSDFHEWPKWSPWAARDPEAKYTIEGEGVGHLMVWTSENRNVGNGSQRITACEPPYRMDSTLNFGNMGSAQATFLLTEENGGTQTTWKFDSHMRRGVPVLMQPFAAYMGFLMEKMLGPDYEAGLQKLKETAEAEVASNVAPLNRPDEAPKG